MSIFFIKPLYIFDTINYNLCLSLHNIILYNVIRFEFAPAVEKEVDEMNEVNKTLYIPLYGKAKVSRQGIIIHDPMAEKIWESEKFKIRGKAKSKWLTYNMAMRARVFDEWTGKMLKQYPEALVLHIGCGLDGRCLRIKEKYKNWIDGDFEDVIQIRKRYYSESENYHMLVFDASHPEQVNTLPDSSAVIVILEGVSMYLQNRQVNELFQSLEKIYKNVYILMDVYTVWGAKASKYKNPINDVGVTSVYGIDDVECVLGGTKLKCKAEHSLTPKKLVNELKLSEKMIFKLLFHGSLYRKIYRLYEIGV